MVTVENTKEKSATSNFLGAPPRLTRAGVGAVLAALSRLCPGDNIGSGVSPERR